MVTETKTYLTGIQVEYLDDLGFFEGYDYKGRIYSGKCLKGTIKNNRIEVKVIGDTFEFGKISREKPNYYTVSLVGVLSLEVSDTKSTSVDTISVKPEVLEEITE